ncbi:MAG: META domain-containing protein [Sporichthyaceae bacterium]
MKWMGALALTSVLAGCGGSTTVVAEGDGGGVGAGKPSAADRPTGEWRTTSIDQADGAAIEGVQPEAFNLRFFDDGRVMAQARCNSLSGQYRIENGRFRVDDLAQTEMGCPGENRHEEDTWIGAFLTSSPAYAFDGTRITLDTDAIRVALKPREEVVPNKPLGGTRWELTHLTDGPAPGAPADPNAAVSASMAPPQTHLQFGVGLSREAAAVPDAPSGSPPSGTLKGRSGCVDFFARAELVSSAASGKAGEETLRFGPLSVDDSQCKAGRTAGVDSVLAVLQGDVIARIVVGTLTLTHASGRGMQLSAAD